MKNIIIKSILGMVLFSFMTISCSDILDEKPRAIFEPEFFKTEQGILGGITSLYAHTRYFYGQYFYAAIQNGTDESTWAQSADGNFRDSDMSDVGQITSSTSRSDAIWNEVFSNINTASGIIENAASVGISEALISEARFFRAWDYFLLVQIFGGVPLDLGSGELAFNTTPSRVSVRNTVPEVYTRAIFPDLKTAIENLPDAGRVTGGVTKTAARFYLAKAYLTYAWWLENPNNIPTYPETSRVDPDGRSAAWYFQAAYDMAYTEGIGKAGNNFGLEPTFYDVNLGSNDRNKEIILYSDHIQDEFFNGSSLSNASGSAPDNYAVWFVTWNYTEIRSSNDGGVTYGASSVQREAIQWGGRPWTRMCPTIEVIKNTFADKTNDSRYDGTFTTVYRGNWDKGGMANATLTNANGMSVAPGDPILTFLDTEEPVTYPIGGGPSGVGAGTLPGRADWVVSPSAISRITYPGLWKMGTYRTDNGTGLGQPNGALTRPWNLAKFSEFYFIAAEAAVKGATGEKTARELLNVIRERAGKWRWDNNGNAEKIVDFSAEMVAATPQVIDINYVLAERSREYYGEGYRWFDLVRTQKWAEIARTYTICGPAKGDHIQTTVTRTIQPFHYLRPIPQGQLDAMTMTEAEKKAYQNPGYN